MERFGDRYHEEEKTPEKKFRESLRTEAIDLSYSRSEIVQEIALKILEKLDLKDEIEEIERGKDDITTKQKLKKLGLLLVREARAKRSWDIGGTEHDFKLEAGDQFLDIHLPPVAPKDKPNMRSETERSLHLIAEYVQHHNIPCRYVLGVTFEKLAILSKRFGFNVVEPNIPKEIQEGVQRVYQLFIENEVPKKSKRKSKGIGKILVCYMTREDFLKRYGNSER